MRGVLLLASTVAALTSPHITVSYSLHLVRPLALTHEFITYRAFSRPQPWLDGPQHQLSWLTSNTRFVLLTASPFFQCNDAHSDGRGLQVTGASLWDEFGSTTLSSITLSNLLAGTSYSVRLQPAGGPTTEVVFSTLPCAAGEFGFDCSVCPEDNIKCQGCGCGQPSLFFYSLEMFTGLSTNSGRRWRDVFAHSPSFTCVCLRHSFLLTVVMPNNQIPGMCWLLSLPLDSLQEGHG